MMTMRKLRHLLEAHGADPAAWPARQRRAAEACLAASEEARRLQAEAAALDRALGAALRPQPAPEALRRRLLRIPVDNPRPARRRHWAEPLRWAWGGGLAALAASAMLGFLVGSTDLLSLGGSTGLLSTADSNGDGTADVSELVYGLDGSGLL